jgi:hypothetical protein
MNFSYPPSLKHRIKEIISAPIFSSSNKAVGWSTVILDNNGKTLGNGTANTRDDSMRIAVSESLEMLLCSDGPNCEIRTLFRFDEFPTRCGIAAGFERNSTWKRSQAEAFERWIWSKWVDEGYEVAPANMPSNLSTLAEHYFGQFDEVRFYQRIFANGALGLNQPLVFGAVVGLKDKGAFPGSRVCSFQEDPWDHAIIEAWRHLKIAENLNSRSDISSVLRERLGYFSVNGDNALKQVSRVSRRTWDNPALHFSVESSECAKSGYYMFRSLCKNYIPWHLGSVDRFVF